MRMLVIGSSGQLARSLTAFQKPGLNVVSVGRPQADLRTPSSIDRAIEAHRPDIVVNAAAFTAVDRAEQEAQAAQAVNAVGAEGLAVLCKQARVPLIHVSTDYVFDGAKLKSYDETDAVSPLSVYGRTKAEGEQRVLAAWEQSIVLRTSWIHSPYGRNFISVMVEQARSRHEIKVVDDQFGCPTYAPHLATAIQEMAPQLTTGRFTGWGIYHAAGAGETTWCGLALEALAVSQWLRGPYAEVTPITSAEYPTAARRPRNSRLNCSKLAAAFNLSLPNWRVGAALSVGETLGRNRTTAAA